VWASGASYDVTTDAIAGSNATSAGDVDSYTATAWDIGATITTGNLGVTGYYYDGDGAGTTLFGNLGADLQNTNKLKKRESDGGYVQVTYVIPTGTKLGFAYGVSNLDKASGETERRPPLARRA